MARMNRKRVCLALGIFFLISCAQAAPATLPATLFQTIQQVQQILLIVGSAFGALMIVFEGVKWVAAQSPVDREDAKKGILYVLIGLFLLKGAENIVKFLLETI
jgi:hypothetical protein